MYCKKCRKLLKNDEYICPSCGFDNNNDFNIENTAELELQKIVDEQFRKTKKEEVKIGPIVCVILVMFLVFVGIHFITSANEKKELEKYNTTTPSTIPSKKNASFKFKKLSFVYPDSFGSTGATIFYKEYDKINITFKTIDQVEYNNYINSSDILDTKLGDYEVKTFAGDNFYAYLLVYKNVNYLITVNYVNDLMIYSENVQLTIHSILDSIKAK